MDDAAAADVVVAAKHVNAYLRWFVRESLREEEGRHEA